MSVKKTIKSAVASSVATVCVLLLAFKLFYVSIFSSLGLAVVSASTLQSLNASRQLVQTLKARNLDRRSKAHSRFLKRTGKKLIATSAAAATLGTAAVIVATVGLEADEYCSELEEIENERALFESRQPQFDYQACADGARSDIEAITREVKEESARLLTEVLSNE